MSKQIIATCRYCKQKIHIGPGIVTGTPVFANHNEPSLERGGGAYVAKDDGKGPVRYGGGTPKIVSCTGSGSSVHRMIRVIAREIAMVWAATPKGVNYAAKPYLQAMQQLDTVTDMYGADDAKGIINYFLSNASTYRGEAARAHKLELKAIVGMK